MKDLIAAVVFLLAALFFLPWLEADKPEDMPQPLSWQEEATFSTTHDADKTVRVWDGKQTVEMTLAEYLPGVVRGEMPAAFESEALKAQAVAERTYVLYRMGQGSRAAHPDADVCMDSGCCNAYLSEEDAKAKWGGDFDAWEQKIQQAVADTDGQILLYGGEPIMAVFHSSSAGSTAASGDVWSADLPYLSEVTSPEGEDSVPNYYSTAEFPASEFRRIFQAVHGNADFSGEPDKWLGEVKLTDSGRVAAVTVGGVAVDGAEMRRLYGLRSTAFTLEYEGDTFIFHVTGYGHGVGMSQYGANALAGEGKTWQEILQWYYTGVEIGGYTN